MDSPTAAPTAAPPTTSTCAPHGGLRGEDAARTVVQGATVPDDHGLTVHCDDAGAYAYTVAPTYALTPAETPFPTPAPTPVPPTPVTTMSMTSTTTTSTTKTEVPTTEAQISCPELKSHGNKVHENPATMPLPHCHGDCDCDAHCQPGYRCSVNHEFTKLLGCASTPDEAIDCVRENQEDVNCVA